MKILIVDDESNLRTLIQQTLEELEDDGVGLLTATNGEEALETIRAEEPNLVFLDVMMPKKNGFDLQRGEERARHESHPHYPAHCEGAGVRSPAWSGGRR
jgi:two-component system alkaline phosphatase synthesis response regulator PhoP